MRMDPIALRGRNIADNRYRKLREQFIEGHELAELIGQAQSAVNESNKKAFDDAFNNLQKFIQVSIDDNEMVD